MTKTKGKSATLREKFWELYRFLADLIQPHPDLKLERHEVNSGLLLQILTGIFKDVLLLVGGYGGGKTSTSRFICSVLGGLPLDLVTAAEIRGTPELTIENAFARPHLGKLLSGQEVVIWGLFLRVIYRIIDELPRIPSAKQAFLLQGVETNRWNYLNSSLKTPPAALYVTANYQDEGSFQIIPPLKDRCSLAIEMGYQGLNRSFDITMGSEKLEEKGARYGLNDLAEQAFELAKIEPAEEAIAKLIEFGETTFKPRLQAKGLAMLSQAEMEAIIRQVSRLSFDELAKDFLRFLISSLSFCIHTGQKRLQERCKGDCKLKKTACAMVEGGGSYRWYKDIVKYARALAWLQSRDEVIMDDIVTIAPFALWHRTSWSKGLLNTIKGQPRRVPPELHAAHTFIAKLEEEFQENLSLFRELETILQDHPREDLEVILKRYLGEVKPEELLHVVFQDLISSYRPFEVIK